MKFSKRPGLGHDYLYFYEEVPENVAELAVRLSDRHFGAGSDGLIYICHSDVADFKMRIFNADGSEANGKVEEVTVDMEQSTFEEEKEISVDLTSSPSSRETVRVKLVPVSMGNPHAVIFTDDAENAPLTTLGAAIEKHEAFPAR